MRALRHWLMVSYNAKKSFTIVVVSCVKAIAPKVIATTNSNNLKIYIFMRNLVCLLLFISIISCNNYNEYITKRKSTDFARRIHLNSKSKELDGIINIDNWVLTDSQIVCRSSGTDNSFYTIDNRTFTIKDSFATKGEGPEEYIMPNIIPNTSNSYLIADVSKKEIQLWEDGNIKKRMSTPVMTMNDPQIWKYPFMGCTEIFPNALIWKMVNIEKGVVCDSLLFDDPQKEGKAIINDFAYRFHNNKFVLLHYQLDKLMIADINLENRLENKIVFEGDTPTSDESILYSDLACTDNFIYLLSQKKVNIEEQSGLSTIEVYNYEGRPVCLIELDMIASSFLIDIRNNRMLFLSPLDEKIHFISWNEEKAN